MDWQSWGAASSSLEILGNHYGKTFFFFSVIQTPEIFHAWSTNLTSFFFYFVSLKYNASLESPKSSFCTCHVPMTSEMKLSVVGWWWYRWMLPALYISCFAIFVIKELAR